MNEKFNNLLRGRMLVVLEAKGDEKLRATRDVYRHLMAHDCWYRSSFYKKLKRVTISKAEENLRFLQKYKDDEPDSPLITSLISTINQCLDLVTCSVHVVRNGDLVRRCRNRVLPPGLPGGVCRFHCNRKKKVDDSIDPYICADLKPLVFQYIWG